MQEHMAKKTLVLMTVTNKDEFHTYGLYSLKAYLLKKKRADLRIDIQVYRSKREQFEDDNVSLKLSQNMIRSCAARILRKNPSLVGFSASVINRRPILRLARLIKEKNPKITVIVGGPETHHNYMYSSESFLASEPAVDILAKFEGEEILDELVEAVLYRSRPLKTIKGIVYREDGKTVATAERPPMDLKTVPSPYLEGVFKPKRTIREYIVENSRGCPYRCAYCSYPAGLNRFLRYFPVARVKKDFAFLLKHKVKYINVADNNFNIHHEQFRQILKTIIRYNKGGFTKISSFYNASRQIIDEDTLKLLAKSGLNITIGVQSTNEDTLKTAMRQSNLDIIGQNLTLMDRYRIAYRLEFIYGLPGDTLADIYNTINFVFDHRAFWVFFYRLVVLKGTYFSQHAEDMGLYYDQNAPFRIIKNRQLSETDLKQIEHLLIFVSIFYNKPVLRKYVYQLHDIFRIEYSRLFELFGQWYDQPQARLLDKRYIDKITGRFMRYLFEHTGSVSGRNVKF